MIGLLPYSLAGFFIVSSLNLYLQTESGPLALKLKHLTKGLLMPFLMLILALGGMKFTLLLALAFSWFGDLFLIGRNQGHFLLGLSSFLIAHILYGIYFYSLIDLTGGLLLVDWACLMVIAWYGVILFKAVNPKGLIRLAMPLYMVAIGAMVTLTWIHFRQKIEVPSGILLLGALFFASSDSVLAFKRLKGVQNLPESYVMFSYITGQFLIILTQINLI